ncbi:MAG: hypothetical protein K0R75_2130, partial [Paenibacillaceae bacterium]|nr:hypothetical protein [Paenibacillaceae bacterium]
MAKGSRLSGYCGEGYGGIRSAYWGWLYHGVRQHLGMA